MQVKIRTDLTDEKNLILDKEEKIKK